MDRGPHQLNFYVLATYAIGCFSKWTALPSIETSDTNVTGKQKKEKSENEKPI